MVEDKLLEKVCEVPKEAGIAQKCNTIVNEISSFLTNSGDVSLLKDNINYF